jgi:hypothetical protein
MKKETSIHGNWEGEQEEKERAGSQYPLLGHTSIHLTSITRPISSRSHHLSRASVHRPLKDTSANHHIPLALFEK